MLFSLTTQPNEVLEGIRVSCCPTIVDLPEGAPFLETVPAQRKAIKNKGILLEREIIWP